jgi:hypothetical protein
MDDDSGQKSPDDSDETRTEQARRFVEEYVAELRELPSKLRKLFN